MNFRRLKHRGAVALGVLLLMVVAAGCGYDRHEACGLALAEMRPNLSLAELTEYADRRVALPAGSIVAGWVTANDSAGNFYKSLVVEEDGSAVEIRIGLYDLYALFPVGCRLAVDVGSLVVGRYDGVLQIGMCGEGWSRGEVEPIAPRNEVKRRVAVVAECKSIEPQVCNIDALAEVECGQLVEVVGVCYIGEEMTWGDVEYGNDADRLFEDSLGRRVVVRTSRYADFAQEGIPRSVIGIRGILYADRIEGEEVIVVRMRDGEDVVR